MNRLTDGGITAGSAPGLNSGAAAMVVAGRQWAQAHGLKPMARLVSYGIGAAEPGLFGLGPAPAVRQALACARAYVAPCYLAQASRLKIPKPVRFASCLARAARLAISSAREYRSPLMVTAPIDTVVHGKKR